MTARSGRHPRRALCLLLLAWLLAGGAVLVAMGLAWPQADGVDVKKKSGTTLDISHMRDGYVMVKQKAGKKKVKARLSKGDATYTYDLNGSGEYEVLPLQMGNGKYSLKVYEQVKGSKYSQLASLSFTVSGMSEEAPFLCPNQYVWYTRESPAVQKAQELCQGLSAGREKKKAICDYVEKRFTYDFMGALAVVNASGVLPDVDGAYERGTGICLHLAAVTACMLRSQEVPAKLVIGYADNNYHAWVSVMLDGQYEIYDPTARLGGISVREYTAERVY